MRKSYLCLILVAVCALVLTSCEPGPDLTDDVIKLQSDMQTVAKRVVDLSESLDAEGEEIDSLMVKVHSLRDACEAGKDVPDVVKEVSSLRDDLDTTQATMKVTVDGINERLQKSEESAAARQTQCDARREKCDAWREEVNASLKEAKEAATCLNGTVESMESGLSELDTKYGNKVAELADLLEKQQKQLADLQTALDAMSKPEPKPDVEEPKPEPVPTPAPEPPEADKKPEPTADDKKPEPAPPADKEDKPDDEKPKD